VNQVERTRHCQSGDRGYEETLLTWTSEWEVLGRITVTFYIHLYLEHLLAVPREYDEVRDNDGS